MGRKFNQSYRRNSQSSPRPSMIQRSAMSQLDYIRDHPFMDWDWDHVSINPHLTTDFVQARLDKPWNWAWLSTNVCIDRDFVAFHSDKPWDMTRVERTLSIKNGT